MTDIKLCKDCKWYKKSWFEHFIGIGDGYDTCHNPVVSGNFVTGKRQGGRFCENMRRPYGMCGEEGKYWEERRRM
jgi:hypothetical protein